jgi:hypothetical protein
MKNAGAESPCGGAFYNRRNQMQNFSRLAGAVTLSLVTAFGAAGCASVSFSASNRPINLQRGVAEENTSLFKDQDSFEAQVKAANLHDGMSPADAFAALGLDIHKFKALTDRDLMDAAYAGANPTPQTEAAMKEIMSLVNRTTVYRLNYKNVAGATGIGFNLSAQTKTTGFDRQLTLIFVDNELKNATKVLSGNPSIEITNTSHIWDIVSGAASGAASVSVRRAAPRP